jgi:hypothetical protein
MGSSLLAHVGTGTSGTQLRFGDGSAGLTAIATIDAQQPHRAPATRACRWRCQAATTT